MGSRWNVVPIAILDAEIHLLGPRPLGETKLSRNPASFLSLLTKAEGTRVYNVNGNDGCCSRRIIISFRFVIVYLHSTHEIY